MVSKRVSELWFLFFLISLAENDRDIFKHGGVVADSSGKEGTREGILNTAIFMQFYFAQTEEALVFE